MDQKSYNFHLAKVLAILAVMAAHYVSITKHPLASVLWIPAWVGLAVFAFSSAYFTGDRYREGFSILRFWRAKAVRLLVPLLVIDVFLAGLMLARGEYGIFHWHSGLAFFGLSGLLTLCGQANASPIGNGLWFFTLLLLFYAIYPALNRLNRSKTFGFACLAASLPLAVVLQEYSGYDISFWETAWFFLMGAYCGRHQVKVPIAVSLTAVATCGMMLPLVRFGLGISWLVPLLMMGLGMGCVLYLVSGKIPIVAISRVLALAAILLEVYVIHVYLFITRWSGIPIIDFTASLVLVVVVAFALHWSARRLGRIFGFSAGEAPACQIYPQLKE